MDFVSVRAKVLPDSSGAVSEIPVLLTNEGPLQPPIDLQDLNVMYGK